MIRTIFTNGGVWSGFRWPGRAQKIRIRSARRVSIPGAPWLKVVTNRAATPRAERLYGRYRAAFVVTETSTGKCIESVPCLHREDAVIYAEIELGVRSRPLVLGAVARNRAGSFPESSSRIPAKWRFRIR